MIIRRTETALRKATEQTAGLHLTPHGILVLALVLVLFLGVYRISLWLHPNARCRRCGGTGQVGGAFFTWSRAWCPKCGGSGMVPRLGTLMTGLAGRGQVRR